MGNSASRARPAVQQAANAVKETVAHKPPREFTQMPVSSSSTTPPPPMTTTPSAPPPPATTAPAPAPPAPVPVPVPAAASQGATFAAESQTSPSQSRATQQRMEDPEKDAMLLNNMKNLYVTSTDVSEGS